MREPLLANGEMTRVEMRCGFNWAGATRVEKATTTAGTDLELNGGRGKRDEQAATKTMTGPGTGITERGVWASERWH